MATERYLIGPGLKDKLGDIIRRVDGSQNPGGEVTTIRTRFDDSLPTAPIFRIGTIGTASWSVGASAAVTLSNVAVTGTTLSAQNIFGAVGTATASRNVAIAREGTVWYLLQAACP